MRKLLFMFSIILIPLLAYHAYRQAGATTLQITNSGGGKSLQIQNTRSQSLTFDGVDDFVDCGNDNSLAFGVGDFAISFWLKCVPTGNIQFVLGKRLDNNISGSETDEGWVLRTTIFNIIRVIIADGVTKLFDQSSSSIVCDNIWHFIFFNADRDGMGDLYVDLSISAGATAGMIAGNSINTTETFKMAGFGSVPLDGQLADVRIFNRALSLTEIQQIYRGAVITDGLVGWWPLQEGGLSEKAYDVACPGGTCNHGTLANFTLSDGWANVQNKNHSALMQGYELYTDDATGLVEIKVPYKVDGSKITPTITGYTKQSDHEGRGYNSSSIQITN